MPPLSLLIIALLSTNRFLVAYPRKIPLSVNVSGTQTRRILLCPSEEFPGGLNYKIVDNSRHRYIIGDVFDSGFLILHADPSAVSRYVLVFVRKDETKYVKITTRHRYRGVCTTKVKEFTKKVWDPYYRRVARIPMDLEVTTKELNDNINAELVPSLGPNNMGPEDSHAPDITLVPVIFSIKLDKIDEFVIGEVKYNGYTVGSEISGLNLMSRRVTWRGGFMNPFITILSKYTDGTEVEAEYRLLPGKCDGFIVENIKRRLSNLCG